MKKLISAIICISILLSVVPMVSQAVDVTTPVFIDFEDFVGGDSTKYHDDYIQFPSASKNYEAPVIDVNHGKSIEIRSSASMNLYSKLTKNAVFGFSYYSPDSNAGFAVSSKASSSSKNNEGWVDLDAFMKVDAQSIKLGSTVLENSSYIKGSWIDFAFGVDYTNHEIDLYINGKYIETYITGKSGFKGTDRFLFSTIASRVSDSDPAKGAAHYFDNIFVYYPPNGATAAVTGVPGDSAEKDEIIVDFGQNVILPLDSSYVSLNDDTTVEAEPVVEHGYVTGLKIKNLSLAGGTQYTVAFPDVKDFLGNGILDYVFTTEAVVPQISIVRKTPDAVYDVGDIAEFKIESAYLSGNDIVIYLNGEVYDTLSADATEFSVELVGGNNEIYAKVSELNLSSDKLNIYIDNTPVINITCQNADAVYEVGDIVKFSISSAHLNGNAIDIYNNGTKVDTVSADATEFTIELLGGNNEICAKVSALSAESQKITIFVDDTPSISITKKTEGTSYTAGDSVKFNISYANLGGNPIEVYHNGLLLETLGSNDEEFTIVLTGGNNTVFAKVPALGIKTETITLLVDELGSISGTVKFFDFEKGEKGISDLGEEVSLKNKDAYSGSIKVITGDDEYGQILCLSHDASTVSNKPRIIVESFQDKKGVYSFEADFKFSRVDERTAILPIKCLTGKGEETFSLYVLDGGKLYRGSDVICDIEADVWYNFKATWNSDTKKSDLYINGEKKASGIEFSKNSDVESFLYVNIIMTHKAGETSSMYMDNIKSCFLAKMANAELSVGSDVTEVPYENTTINLNFDQPMNADSLRGIKFTAENGKEIFVDFTSDDNQTFIANVASLSPNTGYSIDLSGVVAQSGAGVSSDSVNFKTKKAPFAIKSAKTTALENSLKVDASIQNNNAEEKSYIVIAAIYTDNMMLSSYAKSYTASTATETPSFTFAKPSGGYELEIYVFDSAKSLNLIDKLIVK